MSNLLQERLDRAERALTRSGFTYTEGAQEWKPPIGPSASQLLGRIDHLAGVLRKCMDLLGSDLQKVPVRLIMGMRKDIYLALVGTPVHHNTTWTDDEVQLAHTEQDYRELQAQHDQVQSRLKAALDALTSAVKTAEFEGHAHRPWHDSAKTLLAGQVPDHTEQPLAMVPECPEVVGYRRPGTECLFNDTTHPENNEALMTVAQHERIMLAMLAAAPKPEGA